MFIVASARAFIELLEYRIAAAEQLRLVVTPALVSVGSLDN